MADSSLGRAVLILSADDKELKKGLDGVKPNVQNLEGAFKSLASAIAVAFTAEKLLSFAKVSIKAFSEQEDAIARLSAALETQGQLTPAVLQQYVQLGAEFQRTTIYGDELIQSMEALLIEVGHVGPEQMKAALRAATDLASGLGIDLRTATMLVAKAFAGNTATLSRYGLVIDETKLKTEGATAVLEAISQQFGGQAAAAADTFSGRLAQLNNAWNDFQEVVGQILVDVIQPMLPALKSLAESMQGIGGWVDAVRTAFTHLLGKGYEVLKLVTDMNVKFLSATNAFGLNDKAIAALKEDSARYAYIARDLANVQTFVGTSANSAHPPLVRLGKALTDAADGAKPLHQALAKVAAQLKATGLEFRQYIDDKAIPYLGLAPDLSHRTEEFRNELAGLTRDGLIPAVETLDTMIGVLPSVASGMKRVATDARSFGDFLRNDLGRTVLGAFQGGGSVIKSIGGSIGGFLAGTTSKVGQAIAGGLTSALGSTIGGALGSVIPGLGTALGALGGSLFGKLFSNPEKQINPIREAFVQAAGGLAQLNEKAYKATGSLALVQQLLSAKNAEQYTKAINDLNAAFEFQNSAMSELQAAIDEYGFTLDELPKKLSQDKLNEQFLTLYKKEQLLTAAGFDFDAVLGKQASSFQTLVLAALKAGDTIPIQLKPAIERLAAMGELVDENGEKLTDISRLNFAETLDAKFNTLIDTIQHLADVIASTLGGAIRSLPPIPTGTITVPEQGTEFRAAAGGFAGRVTRPTLFLAGEAGAETVQISRDAGGGVMGDLVIKTEGNQTLGRIALSYIDQQLRLRRGAALAPA